MRRAKALLFSSVRDTSGNVVLEAMAARCPVICLNHQGAGQMTDDSCALRVEPAPWDDTVSGFAAALQRLDQNPELVHALGNAGRARVAERFTWQEKIHAVNELYASVMRQ
jgi:glycosyltransferase involved in cell wall biosynthesis